MSEENTHNDQSEGEDVSNEGKKRKLETDNTVNVVLTGIGRADGDSTVGETATSTPVANEVAREVVKDEFELESPNLTSRAITKRRGDICEPGYWRRRAENDKNGIGHCLHAEMTSTTVKTKRMMNKNR